MYRIYSWLMWLLVIKLYKALRIPKNPYSDTIVLPTIEQINSIRNNKHIEYG